MHVIPRKFSTNFETDIQEFLKKLPRNVFSMDFFLFLAIFFSDDSCGREAECDAVVGTLNVFGRRFCCLDSGRSALTFSTDVNGYPVCACSAPAVVDDGADEGL